MAKSAKKETFAIDKCNDFNRWYERILIDAEIVDKRYPVKGMPVFTAYGNYLHSAVMRLLEDEYEELEVDKVQFPLLIPEKYLNREMSHLQGFSPEVFWVIDGGNKKLEEKLALRPTSETAIYSIFSLWVRSFRDLPLKIHQTCAVYRYETKDTLPLIRAREIYWNELHSCHSTECDAVDFLERVWASILRILNDQLGVYGVRLRRPIWDKFAGAEFTDVLDTVLPSGKVLQSIGAHYLKQIFSKVFDISFLTSSGEFENVYMTCVGVSTRVLASALSIHGDKNGLILPTAIARYHVVIVPLIYKGEQERVLSAAKEWTQKLKKAGIRYILDDSDKTPGEKYYFWEMKGVPIRMEIGPRDVNENKVCLIRRDNRQKVFEPTDTAIEKIFCMMKDIDQELKSRSKKFHESKISTTKNLDEATNILAKVGGFVRIPFHSDGIEGKKGDQIIRNVTGGEIRGFCTGEVIEPNTKCAVTGEPAVCWAYVAKSY